ncbi:MAG: hypothetical protein MK132_18740 [Lentisphaerales bacterium]|nr:hypothetical protein [Lentisphaerales bacterium]
MNWYDLDNSVLSKALRRKTDFPLTEDMLCYSPGGELLGMPQDVGIGWAGKRIADAQVLILTIMGGLRQDGGSALALGDHTGH